MNVKEAARGHVAAALVPSLGHWTCAKSVSVFLGRQTWAVNLFDVYRALLLAISCLVYVPHISVFLSSFALSSLEDWLS
jgi:hypothetical protein